MPVSKEVKVLRQYESSLLRGYQVYLKHLLKVCVWGGVGVFEAPAQGVQGEWEGSGGGRGVMCVWGVGRWGGGVRAST